MCIVCVASPPPLACSVIEGRSGSIKAPEVFAVRWGTWWTRKEHGRNERRSWDAEADPAEVERSFYFGEKLGLGNKILVCEIICAERVGSAVF